MTPPRGCTNLKLRQLARVVTSHYERHFASSPLRITQYSLLSHVVLLGPIAQGALARTMRLSASALSRNLQPLVAAGWVQVGPGGDARSRIVQPTLAGLAQREEGQRLWKRAQLELNQRLGAERVQALHALIDDCVVAMGPENEVDDEQ